jgi:hypothetical protein
MSMIDQSLIRSGFDLELLLSERYIKYFLLTSFETGAIPWWTRDVNQDTGAVTNIIIHPPVELEQNRLYEPHPDFEPHPFLDTVPFVYTESTNAMEVTLLPEEEEADIRVQLVVSAIAPPLGEGFPPVVLTEQQMHIDARFFVQSDPLPSGFQGNVRLRLELVDIGGPFIAVASGLPGFDKARTLARMKEEFDRDVPLSIVGEGGSIMQIETKKFFSQDEDDAPTCIGLYVNLNLRDGPEPTSFVGPRGDLALAENFLPKDHHLAFGFNGGLYPKLGTDIFQRMAAPKEGGGFFYPLDPSEPGLGKIISAKVYPEGPGVPDGADEAFPNVLVVEVEGEIFVDNFFDPNVVMKIRLIPTIRDGILTFKTDFDLDIPSAGWVVVGFALLGFLSLNLALPLTIAALAAKAIAEKVGEDVAAPMIDAQLEDASLLEAFPNKLAVEVRRWDPMYTTLHQVVSLVNEVAINRKGMGFAAFDMRVGKEPKPRDDVVVRSEVRDEEGNVSGLLYRVSDLDQYVQQADIVFPGTDRLDFVGTVPPDGIEDPRVHLSVDQAVDRIRNGRLLAEIPYTPYKIDEVDNQIYQILTLSRKEVPEIQADARRLLRQELRASRGQEFRDRAREELTAELGRDPTEEEVETRFSQILNAEVDAGADKRYRRERERYLKFDLEPSEYADLQRKGILVLEHQGLQIVKMKERFGGAAYYRDRADEDKGDNLLRLPRYKSQRITD